MNIPYLRTHAYDPLHSKIPFLFTGSSVLDSLRSQRGTLKGAQRRIIDMANTLGLSNHTMQLIKKRVTQDKYLLFGGMFVTCVIIVLVIIYIA